MSIGGSWSFLDFQLGIVGPGGSFSISEEGIAEEGVTFAMRDAKNTMTQGADGSTMHSLHASKGGIVTVRLLKVSPLNAKLDAMYRYQAASSANWGQNLLSGSNPVSGDSLVAKRSAFQKRPDYVAAVEGGINEWLFDVGVLDAVLGAGFSF